MTNEQAALYHKMDTHISSVVRHQGPINWWNFYDILEIFEENLPPREFKGVAKKLADKWFPGIGLSRSIYPKLKN